MNKAQENFEKDGKHKVAAERLENREWFLKTAALSKKEKRYTVNDQWKEHPTKKSKTTTVATTTTTSTVTNQDTTQNNTTTVANTTTTTRNNTTTAVSSAVASLPTETHIGKLLAFLNNNYLSFDDLNDKQKALHKILCQGGIAEINYSPDLLLYYCKWVTEPDWIQRTNRFTDKDIITTHVIDLDVRMCANKKFQHIKYTLYGFSNH